MLLAMAIHTSALASLCWCSTKFRFCSFWFILEIDRPILGRGSARYQSCSVTSQRQMTWKNPLAKSKRLESKLCENKIVGNSNLWCKAWKIIGFGKSLKAFTFSVCFEPLYPQLLNKDARLKPKLSMQRKSNPSYHSIIQQGLTSS